MFTSIAINIRWGILINLFLQGELIISNVQFFFLLTILDFTKYYKKVCCWQRNENIEYTYISIYAVRKNVDLTTVNYYEIGNRVGITWRKDVNFRRRYSNAAPRCISPAKSEQIYQRTEVFVQMFTNLVPDIYHPILTMIQCDNTSFFSHSSTSHGLWKERQSKNGDVNRGMKVEEREGARERKRDSLLIRTRHSLGTVVADHRRHRRQRVLTKGCWQAQAHAKAPSCV